MTECGQSVIDIENVFVGRTDAIHIQQAGLTDGQTVITRSLAEELTEVIRRTCGIQALTSLEILVVSADPAPTVVIHPSPQHSHQPNEVPKQTRSRSYQTLTEKVATITEELLPEWFGIDVGDLHLKPLGLPAVPTARVLKTQPRRRSDRNTSISLRSVLESFTRYQRPMVCQLLIEPRGQTYEVVIRTADFSNQQRILSRAERTAAIAEPPVDPLDEATPHDMTTSLQLAARLCRAHDADIDGLPLASAVAAPPKDVETRLSPAAHAARMVVGGVHEYTALLSGRAATEHYASISEVDPTLAVSEQDLSTIIDILPTYADTGPPTAQNRSSPKFRVIDRRRDATQTASGELLEEPTRATGTSCSPQTDLLSFTETWLSTMGHPQDDDTTPDCPAIQYRGHPIDSEGGVAVVDPTADHSAPLVSTMGRLIQAANKAARTGRHLLVVTPTKDVAQRCQEVLLCPFRDHAPTHTELYSLPVPLSTDTGQIVVVPADNPVPTWSITPDGDRLLSCGDQILTRDPVTTAPTEISYSLPRLQRQGTSVTAVDADGTHCQQYGSLAAARDDYLIVSQPSTPVQHAFPTTATVVAQRGLDLQRPTIPPLWKGSLSKNSPSKSNRELRYHQEAFRYFLTTHAIKIPDSEPLTNLQAWYLAWHREQSSNVYEKPGDIHTHAPYDIVKTVSRSGSTRSRRLRRNYPQYQWRLPAAIRVAETPQAYP